MYTTGIAWRDDKVEGISGSWNDLTNESAKGKIFMLDDFQEGDRPGEPAQRLRPQRHRPGRARRRPRRRSSSRRSTCAATPPTRAAAAQRRRVDPPRVERRHRQHAQPGQEPGDLQVRDLQGGHPGRLGLHGDPGRTPSRPAPRCCSSTGSSTRATRRRTSSTGYPMPIEGAEDAFAELAADDPAIEVTTDDLESGSQFKELSGVRTQGLGPRLDGGQGVSERLLAPLPGAGGAVAGLLLRRPVRDRGRDLASAPGASSAASSTAGTPSNYADALDPLFAPVLLRSVGYARRPPSSASPSATRWRTRSPASAAAGRTP